jgi:hypothetical protein
LLLPRHIFFAREITHFSASVSFTGLDHLEVFFFKVID